LAEKPILLTTKFSIRGSNERIVDNGTKSARRKSKGKTSGCQARFDEGTMAGDA
jgi:hypothetical protein